MIEENVVAAAGVSFRLSTGEIPKDNRVSRFRAKAANDGLRTFSCSSRPKRWTGGMSGACEVPERAELHRAQWLAPVCAPPSQNGAVLTLGGRVVAAGPFQAVKKECPPGARMFDHGRAALLPALVNAHTHLELSGLKGKIPFPQPGFREWIALLFELRETMGKTPQPRV